MTTVDCLFVYLVTDYVLEKSVFQTVDELLQSGRSTESIVDSLVKGYHFNAPLCKLFSAWLFDLGKGPSTSKKTSLKNVDVE